MKNWDIIKGFYQANVKYYKSLVKQRKIQDVSQFKANKLYELVHQESAPCFVLSTGRCGTKLLSKLLKQANQVEVFHAPQPELLWLSKYAYKHYKDKNEALKLAFDAARYEMIRNAFIQNKKYIETNNYITFFAYQIAALYPKAKFIHLIRRPEPFVRSGLGRGWYSNTHLYDEGRIVSSSSEWTQFSVVEKNSWLWNETNSFIDKFKETIDDEKILTVKSDDLFSNSKICNSIMIFLKKDLLSLSKIRKIISKPINKQRKGKVYLNEEQKKEVIRITPISKRYYD